MPRYVWPLLGGRPVIEVILTRTPGGQPIVRTLLADTGAGSRHAGFELILDENDCLLCGGIPSAAVILGGAYTGPFPTYIVQIRLPAAGFDHHVPAVGVPTAPSDFDGIACFRFLSRFSYGNFGNPDQFGIEL